MKTLREYFAEDSGAVTADWVALSAGILLLGIAVVFGIFNAGVSDVVDNMNRLMNFWAFLMGRFG